LNHIATAKDNLSEFEVDGLDSDEEPEELLPLKNEHELNLKFSKNAIVQHINNLIEFEASSEEFVKWENKLNKAELQVAIKKGGTALSEDLPYLKTELYFNEYIEMEKLIRCIYKNDIRMQWDKNL